MGEDQFELFKAHYAKANRDALLRLAYDWQFQCQLIARALEHLQQENCGLLAVNDLCCDVIISQGAKGKLTPELMQPYIEKRVMEFAEGRDIAATGIRKHAELFLKDVRSNISRDAGEKSGKKRKISAAEQHKAIRNGAKKLIDDGTPQHEIASKLAKRHSLSSTQIRTILKGYEYKRK